MNLIEPSHDLDNQTVSCTNVFMAEWSEYKTEDQRRSTGLSSNPKGFAKFVPIFTKDTDVVS